MPRIRSKSDLQNALAEELAWRRKELHALKTMVVDNEKTSRRDLYLRAGITLLYAHWEGFVRNVGTHYLEFVARSRIRNEQLPPSFLAIAVGNLVRGVQASSKLEPCLAVVDFFRSQGASQSSIKWKTAVKTKANLNATVFREIVASLGLDYSRFATKEKLIDERLLKNRNSIAHGHYLIVDFTDYVELHTEVVGMMEDFANQIENAVLIEAYRLPAQAAAQ
jgi:hypothetical protein